MIKDGFVYVYGAFIDNQIPYVVTTDENGNEEKLYAEPCKCGCEDVELVENAMYEPSLYSIRCANPDCGRTVPDEIQDYAYFHDDGLVAAVKTWNAYRMNEDLFEAGVLVEDVPEADLKADLEAMDRYIHENGKTIDKETGEII